MRDPRKSVRAILSEQPTKESWPQEAVKFATILKGMVNESATLSNDQFNVVRTMIFGAVDSFKPSEKIGGEAIVIDNYLIVKELLPVAVFINTCRE